MMSFKNVCLIIGFSISLISLGANPSSTNTTDSIKLGDIVPGAQMYTAEGVEYKINSRVATNDSVYISTTNKAGTAWQNPYYATNFTWSSDGTQITLTSYTGSNNVIIPDYLDGLPVTSFGTIFRNNGNITSIQNGNNIYNLDDYAFQFCISLNNISLNSITNIGSYAFMSCVSLTYISLPKCTILGENSFNNCTSLKTIEIPNVLTINQLSFYNCYSLSNINIDNIKNIKNGAFALCTSLKTITLNNVTNIEELVFSGCNTLNSVYFSSNVPAVSTNIYAGLSINAITNYVINPVATGWTNTLANQPVVRLGIYTDSITLNGETRTTWINGITNEIIALRTYYYGSPDIIESPASWFRSDASGTITGFNYSEGVQYPNIIIPWEINGIKIVSLGANFLQDITTISNMPTNFIAPRSVTNIADYAFAGGQTKLQSITIPSIDTISYYGLSDCESLKQFNFSNIKKINESGFRNCRQLKRIDLSSVTNIGIYAFRSCTNLNEVLLGDIKYIGNYAFGFNNVLTNVTFNNNAPSIGINIYTNSPNVINYVINPVATGWTNTLANQPVVRLGIYTDSITLNGTSITSWDYVLSLLSNRTITVGSQIGNLSSNLVFNINSETAYNIINPTNSSIFTKILYGDIQTHVITPESAWTLTVYDGLGETNLLNETLPFYFPNPLTNGAYYSISDFSVEVSGTDTITFIGPGFTNITHTPFNFNTITADNGTIFCTLSYVGLINNTNKVDQVNVYELRNIVISNANVVAGIVSNGIATAGFSKLFNPTNQNLYYSINGKYIDTYEIITLPKWKMLYYSNNVLENTSESFIGPSPLTNNWVSPIWNMELGGIFLTAEYYNDPPAERVVVNDFFYSYAIDGWGFDYFQFLGFENMYLTLEKDYENTYKATNFISSVYYDVNSAITSKVDYSAYQIWQRIYNYGSSSIIESPSDWFTYSGNTITGFNYEIGRENIVIPWEINGNVITIIGDSAFLEKSSITNIQCPRSVSRLEGSSFSYCSSLHSLTIPNLSYIGPYTFLGCTSLGLINIDAPPPIVYNTSFYNIPLGQITNLVMSPTIKGWTNYFQGHPVHRASIFANNLIINDKDLISEILPITIFSNAVSSILVWTNNYGLVTQLAKCDKGIWSTNNFSGVPISNAILTNVTVMGSLLVEEDLTVYPEPAIPSIWNLYENSYNIVTVKQDVAIYKIDLSAPSIISNDFSQISFSGNKEAKYEIWLNFLTTNALSVQWDSRMDFGGSTPDLTVTGQYKIACSTIDGTNIIAKQVYPTVYEWNHSPTTASGGSYETIATYERKTALASSATNSIYLAEMPCSTCNFIVEQTFYAGTVSAWNTNTYLAGGIYYFYNQNHGPTLSTTNFFPAQSTVGTIKSRMYIKRLILPSEAYVRFYFVMFRAGAPAGITMHPIRYRKANELEDIAYKAGWRP